MVGKAVLFAPSAQESGHPARGATFAQSPPGRLALFPIANRPLLFHALDRLQEAGIRQVGIVPPASTAATIRQAVATGHWDMEVTWLDADNSGSGHGRMEVAEGFVDEEPFVLHLGDSLTPASLQPLTAHAPDGLGARILVRDGEAQLRVVDLASGRFGGRHQAGVYVFGSKVLKIASGVGRRATCEREIGAAMDRLAERGGQCDTVPVRRWWRYGGHPGALLDANRLALEELEPDHDAAVFTNSAVEGPAVIHPTATLDSTIVRGPAVIGADTMLRHAYVGPYTSIGAEVLIEGAEVENSIVLERAVISHPGSRLDSSVVGAGARVFKDFRLPKAIRLNLGDGAEIALT